MRASRYLGVAPWELERREARWMLYALTTEAREGNQQDEEPAEWVLLIQAARYLGVPPWELEQQPAAWVYRAVVAQYGETKAEADAQREAQARR